MTSPWRLRPLDRRSALAVIHQLALSSSLFRVARGSAAKHAVKALDLARVD